MKWRKVADHLNKEAEVMRDLAALEFKDGLLKMKMADPRIMAPTLMANAKLLDAMAAAIRAGIKDNNFPGG